MTRYGEVHFGGKLELKPYGRLYGGQGGGPGLWEQQQVVGGPYLEGNMGSIHIVQAIWMDAKTLGIQNLVSHVLAVWDPFCTPFSWLGSTRSFVNPLSWMIHMYSWLDDLLFTAANFVWRIADDVDGFWALSCCGVGVICVAKGFFGVAAALFDGVFCTRNAHLVLSFQPPMTVRRWPQPCKDICRAFLWRNTATVVILDLENSFWSAHSYLTFQLTSLVRPVQTNARLLFWRKQLWRLHFRTHDYCVYPQQSSWCPYTVFLRRNWIADAASFVPDVFWVYTHMTAHAWGNLRGHPFQGYSSYKCMTMESLCLALYRALNTLNRHIWC